MNRQGSSLLVILLTMALVGTCALNVWKSTAYTAEVMLQRQEYLTNAWLVQGVLAYGIELCKENFDTMVRLRAKKRTIDVIKVPEFHVQGSTNYSARIAYDVARDQKKIVIKASIKKGDQQVCIAQCAVQEVRSASGRPGALTHLAVTDWHVGK